MRLILAALLLALPLRDAAAQPAALTGAVLTLAGKSVPLPGAGWRILAEGEAGPERMQVAILARAGDTALAVIRANPAPRRAIHPLARDCTRRDSYFAAIRYDTPVDGYCDFGNLVLPDWQAAEGVWGMAAQALRAAAVPLPAALVEVGAQARNQAHAVDVRYYLPLPQADTPPTAAEGWARHPLSPAGGLGNPQTALVAAQLIAFAWTLQPELERGLRGRLAATNPPLPEPWDMPGLQQRRRIALDGLLAGSGLAAAERAALLDEAEAAQRQPERQPWSREQRALAKVVSYRLASTTDTLLVSWLVTGSAAQTFGFAAANAVLKPMLAYVNEMAWASSGVGRPRTSLVPVDLGPIGADRAP